MDNYVFMLSTEEETTQMAEELIKEFGGQIIDYQKSKVFSVQNVNVVIWILVCTRETFDKISDKLNAEKHYF